MEFKKTTSQRTEAAKTVCSFLNIIEWYHENGNPKPTWEIRTESVITTFLPSSVYILGKRPELLEEIILNLLGKKSLSKSEIANHLGYKNILSE